MNVWDWFRQKQRKVARDVRVRTVTFGRKKPVERGGNTELILTAEVQRGQAPEDVIRSLRNIVKPQLEEIKNEEGYDYEQGTTDQNSGRY